MKTIQENYHLLVESIRDYAIYMLDISGHIASWNVGAERSKGYTEEEAVGQHFSIFFTPEDREKGKPEKELNIALSKGRYEEEGWRIRKNGERFWANIIITPVRNEVGTHVGFAKITRDLTEKKRNEELYLLLVNQVKEYAIFMMDPKGDILTWNEGAERIKGYSSYEIVGRNFSEFYLPEEKNAAKPEKELAIALRTGKFEEEGWRLKKDGSLFWASVVISPVYTDRHIGFAKVTRDLTEKKETEKLHRANLVLESTNKELERFAYTVSHDLKEPLRKISTYAHFMKNDQQHPLQEKQLEYVSKTISAAKRMNTMIEDILNFSSLSNLQHFERQSLKDVLSDTLELLDHQIEEKQAEIESTELPTAIFIPSQMKQLFQNMISNSLKFSRNGVPVKIKISHCYLLKEKVISDELWPADQYLQITFADNGIGFENKYANTIFNLFDRLHSKMQYEGSGMGLAICKKIAENHGGIITANGKEGEGALFQLLLPG